MMNRSAIFSPCGFHRFRLSRWWGAGPRVGWFMLNPSDAGEIDDDQTSTKCTGFTARWGYMGFEIINPWSLILTESGDLPRAAQPSHPDNDRFIDAVASEVDLLIVAWGCESVIKRMAKKGMSPLNALARIRANHPRLQIECLGLSPSGNPYHPLMLPYSTQRIPFEVQ